MRPNIFACNKCDFWKSHFQAHNSHERPMGGKRWRAEGGSERWEGEIEWEGQSGTERSTPQQNFSNKLGSRQSGFSPFIHAWLPSSSKNNYCCIQFWCRKQRGGSLLVKMDHLIRSRSRRRTPLFLFVLVHVMATQAGKVFNVFNPRAVNALISQMSTLIPSARHFTWCIPL